MILKEYKEKLKNNTLYYYVNYNPGLGFPSRYFNVKNYEIVRGEFVDISKNLDFKSTKYGVMPLDERTEIFDHEEKAKNFAYSITFKLLKQKTIENLHKNDFPGYPISPNFEIRCTSNPLRFGERNLSQVIQTNTVNNEVNEQKIIQLLSVTIEDISMIAGLLNITPFINDYAKKLLGKYAIIELNSLYTLLNGSHDHKGLKDFNDIYQTVDLIKLNEEITKLENKYNFRNVRNKIAAHKSANLDLMEYIKLWENITGDAILEYYNLFISHINEILMKYYPEEKMQYFVMPQKTMKAFFTERIENNYKPFHNFEM